MRIGQSQIEAGAPNRACRVRSACFYLTSEATSENRRFFEALPEASQSPSSTHTSNTPCLQGSSPHTKKGAYTMKTTNLKDTIKRITTLTLASAMALSLISCGSSGRDDSGNTEQKEYVYLPEYISLNGEDDISYFDIQMAGNSLYYTSYIYDETTMTGENRFLEYSLETNAERELPVTLEENSNIGNYTIDEAGNIYTVIYYYGEPDANGMVESGEYLCKFDADGNQIYKHDITELLQSDENNSWISDIVADEQGRVYTTSDDLIRLFDQDGSFHGEVNHNNGWINGIGTGKDGKVYICYYDQNSADGGTALAEVDFNGKQLGQTYTNFPNSNGNGGLSAGLNKDFLVSDSTGVYEYDLATQTYEVLLDWLDSDINGTYVSSVHALENGKLLAVIRDWNSNKTELAYLTRTASAELPEKQQLVIGTLYESQALQAAAVDFNKNSDTYRITIKKYIDQNNWTETSWEDGIKALNNDITSKSNCPDIIDLSSLNIEQLASKGVLDDLTPYLEQSSVLSKADFLESVIEGYTFDGSLVCIPSTFNLMTIAAKTSDVGAEMGWTIEEMMAYAKENPKAVLFDGTTKSSMLYTILNYSQGSYVDWSNGECKFDSAEFKQLLEFVNSFPTEYDWQSDDRSTPVKIQAGEILLDEVYIYELNSIQEYEAKFNEPVTFIGYPNPDGTSGCYMTGSDMYGIGSKSDNKEGAWEFIESYLVNAPDSMFSWGLYTNKQFLEEKIAEETKVEYLLDENGEQVLDENGDPIPMGGMSSVGYGDWEYTYHIPTEEEVAQLMELIAVAQPSYGSDQEISQIIQEECEAYFQGQKSVDDVAGIIQSRVQIYVNENR